MTTPTFVDLHQDLLPHIEARHLYGDEWQTDWEQLERSPVRIVVASTWPGYNERDILSADAGQLIERYMRDYAAIARESDAWRLVLDPEDIGEVMRHGCERGILVHVEGVGALDKPVEEVLDRWMSLGCRSVGIVWNEANGLAHGPQDRDLGLTDLGRRAVGWLDRRPMLIDLAHMSERSFWDTLDVSSGPVAVSHANVRALCDHPRNLWDDQLRAVAERAGVVGLVFSTRFLEPRRRANVETLVDHAEYMIDVMGVEHVAVGSDFGGVLKDRMPDLNRVDTLGLLVEEMQRRGFEQSMIEAVTWRNAERVLMASLGKKSPGSRENH